MGAIFFAQGVTPRGVQVEQVFLLVRGDLKGVKRYIEVTYTNRVSAASKGVRRAVPTVPCGARREKVAKQLRGIERMSSNVGGSTYVDVAQNHQLFRRGIRRQREMRAGRRHHRRLESANNSHRSSHISTHQSPG